MVDKLLALAAVEHRQAIAPQPLDAGALLRDAAESERPRPEAAGIALEVAAPADAALAGDPFLLRQALVNLLDNALDFAPAGSLVRARALRDGAGLRLEVADRGAGVPEYARQRVFERFYSLPRPGGGSRSSGLGLPFVALVAALHGGSASLRAREGGGTVAALVLPAPA
jgi:two-component system sensor histidine kinase CreC